MKKRYFVTREALREKFDFCKDGLDDYFGKEGKREITPFLFEKVVNNGHVGEVEAMILSAMPVGTTKIVKMCRIVSCYGMKKYHTLPAWFKKGYGKKYCDNVFPVFCEAIEILAKKYGKVEAS